MSGLHVRGLRVALPGAGDVLQDIDLDVDPGEIVAIVGSSGAGKSVLARTLLGFTQEQSGASVSAARFDVAGRDARRAGRRDWRRMRGRDVALVLQDALQSLDPLRTIQAEVAETLALRGVPHSLRRERVVTALADAGLPEPAALLSRRSGELSGGMRQRALIASAMAGGADILIADEPTTALDATVAVHVLDLLARLRDEGRAVLLISHDLAAVARVSDRVAVLEHGVVVEKGPTAQVLSAPRHEATRALLAAAPRGPKSVAARPGGRMLLSAEGLGRAYRSVAALSDVDLRIHAGEVVGVVGASGSGKTTLARLLVGAEHPDTGTIALGTPAPRIRLVPQDPAGSFDPRWSVERILTASSSATSPPPRQLLERVGLDPALLHRRPATLSGGQRQRVAIARTLAASPDILVCDEPVSALDVATQAGILELILTLPATVGTAVVFISHDLAVVRRVSDRVLVMSAGRVVEEGATEAVFTGARHPFTRELIAAASSAPQA
ncbi:peptide/nickel transport system ATP-binding protein [Microbacterium sp. SORGH_AS428]|uniref:ABC transporter ATP-binding protein n=1 Tax=Microbacterium sp. SORGH_AS_0428 TaxID=3041788 RepID=UPI00285A9AC7|nr:ABC transporter ATP-binding protein [Microbacterium sp. SORGH_AS_0428]MDR6198199.1 peptide/nickel transport system ATP-binding protein [Microbacterium sp. SORGH_AS_0428]